MDDVVGSGYRAGVGTGRDEEDLSVGGEREPPRLAVVAAEVADGEGDPRELFETFLEARVCCQRLERPGFLAVGEPPDAVVPVFSSLAELGAFAGETDYFSTTGRDVLGLLPEGYDLVLDPAGENPLRLNSAAWRAQSGIEVAWGGSGEPPGESGPGGARPGRNDGGT